ncbi:cytochrome P450 [Trametes elegans]|nr:cytochrome P450 [Trametes elegans]
MSTVPPRYLAATVAGVTSWVFLHRRTVRGDHALSFYLLSSALIYLSCRLYPDSWESPLRTTAAILSVYFSVLSAATVAHRISPWHPLAAYPGPFLARLGSLWLVYVSSTGKRHMVMDRLHQQYGTFVRIGPDAVSINSPSAIPLYNTLEKAESYRLPAHDAVASIFLKQDSRDGHRERKRVWGALFTPSSVSYLTPALERRTWQLMQCIERRQSAGDGFVDLAEAFYHWSYDLGGDMVFGACNEIELMRTGDVKGLVATGKFSTAMMDTFGQAPWLLDILWRIPATKDMHQLVRMTAKMAHNRVRAQDGSASRDLVSHLLEGRVPMSDLERDSMIAILAASENTTITLSLACYFLTAEPQYCKQLRHALDHAFPDPLGPLPASVLAAIPLLDGVLNEALRLGSLFFLPRITPPDGVHVDGRFIPGETVVALAAYTQQTSPDNFFPQPMHFRPERWQPEGLGPQTRTNRAALAAFSYGQHACMGKALAYQQMRYVLARLVLAHDMAFPPGFDVRRFREGIMGMGTPHLEEPLTVKLTPRPGVSLDDIGERV